MIFKECFPENFNEIHIHCVVLIICSSQIHVHGLKYIRKVCQLLLIDNSLFSGLPFEAYSIWQAYPFSFGEIFCIGKALLTEMTSYASVLTITAFTVERYIAICHPLMSHKIADLRRSVIIIICIWTISFIIALPYPIHTRTLFYEYSPTTGKPLQKSLVCNIPPQWISEMTIMFQISTFLFFIVPMTAIIILYVLIAITLRRTALNRANSEESTGGHHSSHTRRVVRMLGKSTTRGGPAVNVSSVPLVHCKRGLTESVFTHLRCSAIFVNDL